MEATNTPSGPDTNFIRAELLQIMNPFLTHGKSMRYERISTIKTIKRETSSPSGCESIYLTALSTIFELDLPFEDSCQRLNLLLWIASASLSGISILNS